MRRIVIANTFSNSAGNIAILFHFFERRKNWVSKWTHGVLYE